MSRKIVNIVILFMIISVSSCNKTEPTDILPYRYDVPVLYSAEYSNYQLREIDFKLKIAVLRGNNKTEADIEEYTGIPDTSFKFTDYEFNNGWVRFYLNSVSYSNDIPTTPYYTSVMLDQSSSPESFDINDKYNERFEAINGYLRKLNGENKVLVSGFARNGSLSGNIEYCNNEPINTWDKTTAKNLLDFTHKIGGTSCLFDALNSMLDRLIEVNAANKSIVILIMNKDDGSSSSDLESVIQKAKTNNIKINLIWLIDNYENVDFITLTQLPCRTGGFLIYMGDIYQVSTIFYGLDKLLSRKVNYYNLDVKLVIDSPNYFLDKYRSGVKIYYPNSKYYGWSQVPFMVSKYGK